MMKKSIILAILLIIAYSSSFAQEDDSSVQSDEFKTLLGHNRYGGVYGAFNIGYSVIDHRQAVLFGGRFEWLPSHSLGIGFGGTGFINEYHFEPVLNQDVFLTGGYGGLIIEPIVMPKYPVHLSFPVLLGIGGISYVSKVTDSYHNMIEDSEAFLILEPQAELELNITRNFRLALGVSYRLTTSFDVGQTGSSAISSDSLRGMSYMMTFKFGKF